MVRQILVWLLVGFSLALAGCSVPAARGLPDLRYAPKTLPYTDQVEMRWREHSFSFLLTQQLTAGQQLQAIATTLMGQQLFALTYDGQQVKTIQRLDEFKRVPVDYLLRDMLWATWPKSSLQQALPQQGFQLVVDHSQREVQQQAKIILHSQHINDKEWHIENKQAGYQIDVSRLDDAATAQDSP
jgi:hypothetical protein